MSFFNTNFVQVQVGVFEVLLRVSVLFVCGFASKIQNEGITPAYEELQTAAIASASICLTKKLDLKELKTFLEASESLPKATKENVMLSLIIATRDAIKAEESKTDGKETLH